MALFIIKLPFYECVLSLRPHLQYRRAKAILFCSLISTVIKLSPSLAAFCLQSLFCELMCWHTNLSAVQMVFKCRKSLWSTDLVENFILQPDFLQELLLVTTEVPLRPFMFILYICNMTALRFTKYGPIKNDGNLAILRLYYFNFRLVDSYSWYFHHA